jgi:hypothetical protein
MQVWLTQFDRGELDVEEAAATTNTEYEVRIAALERKVGQLTPECFGASYDGHRRGGVQQADSG